MKRREPGQPGYQIELAARAEPKYKPMSMPMATPPTAPVPMHRMTCDFCGATLKAVEDLRLIRCASCRAYLYPCTFCPSTFDRRGCPVSRGKACRHDHGDGDCQESVHIVYERPEARR